MELHRCILFQVLQLWNLAPLGHFPHLPAINVPTFSPLIATDVANVPSPVPASDDVAPLCQPVAPSSGSALPLSSPHHDVSEASTQLESVAPADQEQGDLTFANPRPVTRLQRGIVKSK
jgi:hypothetical protein